MTLTVSFAVLLAALLHASWNAMIKGGGNVLFDTASVVGGAAICALPLVFWVPLPAPESWPYIGASVTIHTAYYFLMVRAYRSGDLSLVYPLMRGGAPLLTAALGIVWLGEWPGVAGLVGIGLISCGVVLLALRGKHPGAALAHHHKAVGYALANAAVIAIYTVIDGRGARLAGDAWGYIVWLFVIDALPFGLWMLFTRRAAFMAAVRPWRALAGGALSFGAYGIAVWAMTRAPVALVASLRETSVLFATLIAVRLLKERLTPRRWMGAAAVVAGILALKLA